MLSGLLSRIWTNLQPELRVLGTIAAIALVSRYAFSAEFGFYEDDWLVISPSVAWCGRSLTNFTWPPRYRPLAWPIFDIFGCSIASFGWKSAYIISFLIYTSLLYSIFCLLRRLFTYKIAIYSVFIFSFLPYDTTQAYLTHTAQLQPALLLMVMAAIQLVRNRYIYAFILSMLSMLTYDAFIMILLGVGMMLVPPKSLWKKRGLVFASCLPILLYFSLRQILWNPGGSYRELKLSDPLALVAKIATGILDLATYLYRIPLFAVQQLIETTMITSILFGIATGVFIIVILWNSSVQHETQRLALAHNRTWIALSLTVIAAGSMAIVTSVEYWPQLLGRSGRYLSVASLALAIAFALLAVRLEGTAPGWRKPVVVLFGSLTAYMASYAFVVQRQYAQIARFQFSIIDQTYKLLPDLDHIQTIVVMDVDVFRKYGKEAMRRSPDLNIINNWTFADNVHPEFRASPEMYERRGAIIQTSVRNVEDLLSRGYGGQIKVSAKGVLYPRVSEDIEIQPSRTAIIRLDNGLATRLEPFTWGGVTVGAPIPQESGSRWPERNLTTLGAMLKSRAEELESRFPN